MFSSFGKIGQKHIKVSFFLIDGMFGFGFLQFRIVLLEY